MYDRTWASRPHARAMLPKATSPKMHRKSTSALLRGPRDERLARPSRSLFTATILFFLSLFLFFYFFVLLSGPMCAGRRRKRERKRKRGVRISGFKMRDGEMCQDRMPMGKRFSQWGCVVLLRRDRDRKKNSTYNISV